MKVPVLDNGYVELIEAWGTGRDGKLTLPEKFAPNGKPPDFEVGLIEAARQSTQGSFRGWETDSKLLASLYNNDPPHSTPFEFAGMVIEVQAPIFVFREWHRHRTQSYNEMSARYAALPDMCYVPAWEVVEQRMFEAQRTKNKQAMALLGSSHNQEYIHEWLEDVKHAYKELECIYRAALDNGIPKELARITMPVGHYSRMRAATNLRNWLAFLTLRMDPKAQWEIRQYANAVGQCIANLFPQTWRLFIAPCAEENASGG